MITPPTELKTVIRVCVVVHVDPAASFVSAKLSTTITASGA